MCQLVFCSSEFYIALFYAFGSWKPRDKVQERGCLQRVRRKHAFMRLSTNFGKSIPTIAYQTFPKSIKLGRACSNDVYSVLRTKAEIIFMTVYAIHVNC